MKNLRTIISDERVVWSKEEDKALISIVSAHGTKKWKNTYIHMIRAIPTFEKTSKQCRERWHNYLNPDILKTRWTEQEIDTLFEGHIKYGTKWSLIGRMLTGRTDNAIKNVYYCKMRKLVRRIAKFTIDQDSFSSLKEFDRTLYVLNNLKLQYIVPLQKCSSLLGDQYIVRIIQKCSITDEAFAKYLVKLISVVPEDLKIHAIDKYPNLLEADKDESLTHSSLHSGEPLLPPFTDCPAIKHKIEPISNLEKSLISFAPYIRRKHCIPIIVQ
jgi:hypothetical protein